MQQVPLIIFVFALGAILGSFGNVLILRVPEGKSLGGRSHCPKCNRALTFIDMIPVLGYVFLGGKCRGCRKSISVQYPLVEAASGLLFVAAFLHDWPWMGAIPLACILYLLLLISVTDGKSQLIPDAFNLPLLALGILYGFLQSGPVSMLLSAAIPAAFFGLQWVISRGRWVGTGDIILGAAIGAAVSDWQLSIMMLMLAYIAGALFATMLLATRTVNRDTHVAFGPFLALGGMIILLWGERVLGILL